MPIGAKIVLAVLFFVCSVLLVFWQPLTKEFGAIQWDAVNVHFFNLRFSSEFWQKGDLPYWTPYIFGGFPQIADPQVAFFYPINLAIAFFSSFTPQLMQYQIILHYFLAGFFSFLLAYYLSKSFLFSLAAGLIYGFGGFMAGHASHVGMQNTAAWLPLIFLLVILSLDKNKIAYSALGGLVLGVAILAGHFQTALYVSFAAGVYFAFDILWNLPKPSGFDYSGGHSRFFRIKSPRKRFFGDMPQKMLFVFIFFFTGFLLSSIQLLPTYELAGQSQRAEITLEMSQTESLEPQSLKNLIYPDYNNVSSGNPYRGPWDRTQNYLYLSVTILFLAAIGAVWGVKSQKYRKIAIFWILLLFFSIFYSFGRYGFMQKYFYLLVPLFDKIRAPANMMILFNISIIGLASVAVLKINLFFQNLKTEKKKWQKFSGKLGSCFGLIVLLAISAEILSSAASNTLLYARSKPDKIIDIPPMARKVLDEYGAIDEAEKFKVFRLPGLETNASQFFKIYAFDGYNPLVLSRHGRFVDAMVNNENLIDLAGIKYLPCRFVPERTDMLEKNGDICVNKNYFPRAFLAGNYQVAADAKHALEKISEVDLKTTVVLEENPSFADFASINIGSLPCHKKDLKIVEAKPGFWKFKVENSDGLFLVVNQANYPGWSAKIDGAEVKIYQADYLFQSVFVPRGNHEIIMEFKPNRLKLGIFLAIISLLSVFIILIRHITAKK